MHRNLLYILIAFVTVYAVRVLPLTLIRKPIKSRFIRSFLRYVPPAMLETVPDYVGA